MVSVLVVEDREEVLSVLSRILKHAGYEVLEAMSASEAEATWHSAEPRPDVLVTDFHLPGENGGELAERLWGERADLPVLVISGKGGVEVASFVSASKARYLAKPFGPRELIAELQALLGGQP